MVYFRNTSRDKHITLAVNSDCTGEDPSSRTQDGAQGGKTEIDVDPFRTVRYAGGGECGVGSLEIRYRSKKGDPPGEVWWKGMVPLEALSTLHINPEHKAVFSDMPGSVQMKVPNDLDSLTEDFESMLNESEKTIEEDALRERQGSASSSGGARYSQPSTPPQSSPQSSPSLPSDSSTQTETPSQSRLPSFSTIVKILLVILGVIGAIWFMMKNKKRLSLY